MPRKKNQPSYPKELVEPIVVGPKDVQPRDLFLDLPNGSTVFTSDGAARVAAGRKVTARMVPLAKHYGRNWPDDALLLAIDLAEAHVFEVRIRKRAGAPKLWDDDRLYRLMTTVDAVKRERGITDRAACKLIAKDRPYSKEWGEPLNRNRRGRGLKEWQRTLEARLQDARGKDLSMQKLMDDYIKTLKARGGLNFG